VPSAPSPIDSVIVLDLVDAGPLMNGEPLSYGHGAPLRLRNASEHGFKHVKWLGGIEFVRHHAELGGGLGGYKEDHEPFGLPPCIWSPSCPDVLPERSLA
jgi:hypothetical protein